MMANSSQCAMEAFQITFSSVYGLLATVICSISIVFNVCNIMILTHKKMISSTNCLLTGIAVSDVIKVVALLPMLLRFRVFVEHLSSSLADPKIALLDEVSSPFWAGYQLFASLVPLIAHTAALWIGVVLALFRYLCIKLYTNPRIKLMFSLERAKLSIVVVYLMVLVVLAPYMSIVFVHRSTYKLAGNKNATIDLYIGTIHPKASQQVQDYSFWVTSVVGKFLPCLVMSLFGILLIDTLNATQERRESLIGGEEQSASALRNARRSKDHRRTTHMLITIITLYAITEIPNAILAIISRHNKFVQCIYNSLGEFLDFVALLNNTVNFVLYCMMSAKFREIFTSAVCWYWRKVTSRTESNANAAHGRTLSTATGGRTTPNKPESNKALLPNRKLEVENGVENQFELQKV